jgi:hypothetical protein
LWTVPGSSSATVVSFTLFLAACPFSPFIKLGSW